MSEFEPQSWIMEMTLEMTPEISDPTEIGDSMEIGERDVRPLTAMEISSGYWFQPISPCLNLFQRLSAITLSHNATYHTHIKHINVTYHYVCEKVASNEAALTYICQIYYIPFQL